MISVAISADGALIASGSYDTTVRVWDVQTGSVLQVLDGHSDVVLSVAFSADGTRIFSIGWDKTVRVWQRQVEGFEMVERIQGNWGHNITFTAFTDDGKFFAFGEGDVVRVWERAKRAANIHVDYDLLRPRISGVLKL